MSPHATATLSDVDTGSFRPITPFAPRPSRSAPTITARSHGLSDTGYKRAGNEDSFKLNDHHKLYVVADGIGGASYGEVASRIAVEMIHSAFVVGSNGFDSLSDRLEDAIDVANDKLYDVMQGNVALSAMGTTVVALALEAGIGTVAHAGDSRAYLLRERNLELLTRDHTMATEYFDLLGEPEAAHHPLNHVLTRALPFRADLEADLLTLAVRPGDVFLLCSDGLTKMMTDHEIRVCLLEEGGIEEGCRRLIDEALQRGGHDNVTVGLVEILDGL